MENSVRENDSLAESACPIKALIPNWLNGKSISKVDQVKGLQKLKDLAMYNMQLEMSTSGRKGFIYDVAQTPDGWDIHTVMKYLKTAGIAFIDSGKDANGGASYNQFQSIDQTMSASVEHYISIARLMDEQMDAITGINDARQGQVKGQSQGLGVTQSALMQSNMATKMYEDLFKQLNEMALNYQGGLVKLSFAGNERYAPIIGDVGINFLEQTVDLELDDFGVYIEEIPPLLSDLTTFKEIVSAALSAGQIGFIPAVELMIEKDIVRGIDKFKKEMKETEKAQAQAGQQAQEAEAAKEQGQQQGKESLEHIKGDYGLQKQGLENEGDIKEIITKGKIDTGLKSVDVALDGLKQNAQAREDTVIK
jgi:hypothetical protein